MLKLDATDYKILSELDLNARLPVSKIAKRLRLSRDVINYRIRQLEKKNIIRKYNAIIDVSRLGFKLYRVYFKFYSINSQKYKELINLLVENNSVMWVGECDGFIDLAFGIWVKTDKEFSEFYTKLIKKYRDNIKEDTVNQVLNYSYLDRAYLTKLKNERKENITAGNEKSNFDDIDIKLLQILSNNARESIINIANKLNMDSSSIIYRIKQLEKKKIIIGYKVDINFHIIKRYFYSVKFYLNNFERIKELTTYLKLIPFVVNFTEAIGSFDVEFDLEVESEEQYFNFIKDIKDKFDFISEIFFFRTHKNYKILDMPEI